MSMNRRVIGLFLVLLLLGLGAGYAGSRRSTTEEDPGRLDGPGRCRPSHRRRPRSRRRRSCRTRTSLPCRRTCRWSASGCRTGRTSRGCGSTGRRGGGSRCATPATGSGTGGPGQPGQHLQLRIELLKGTNLSVSGAKGARQAALESTLRDGNLDTDGGVGRREHDRVQLHRQQRVLPRGGGPVRRARRHPGRLRGGRRDRPGHGPRRDRGPRRPDRAVDGGRGAQGARRSRATRDRASRRSPAPGSPSPGPGCAPAPRATCPR